MKNQTQCSEDSNFTDYMKVTVQIVNNFFNSNLNSKLLLNIEARIGLASKELKPSGERLKRIEALLFFLPFILIGYCWSIGDWKRTSKSLEKFEIIKHLFSFSLMFSRFLVFKAVKNI